MIDAIRWCLCRFAVVVGMGLTLSLVVIMRFHDPAWRETYR